MENTKLTERELDLIVAAHNFGVKSFARVRILRGADAPPIKYHAQIVTEQSKRLDTREALRDLFENRAQVFQENETDFEAL